MTYTLKAKLSGSTLDILKELRTMVRLVEDAAAGGEPGLLAGQTLDDDGRQLSAWLLRKDNE